MFISSVMRQNTKKSRLIIVALAILSATFAAYAEKAEIVPEQGENAENDFVYNNIIYTIIDKDAKTCRTKEGRVEGSEFIAGNTAADYLNIPETVKNGADTYKVTEIGNFGFCNCTELTAVNMPFLISVGDYAFYGCTSLLRDGSSHSSIGVHAFDGCRNLRMSLNLRIDGQCIGDYAYANSGVSSVDINFGILEQCGKGLFMGCPNISNVNIYSYRWNEVTQEIVPVLSAVPDSCFYECSKLQTVTMRETLELGYLIYESIGVSAFENCNSLSTLNLYGAVKTIKEKAFAGCENLNTVYAYGVPPTITDNSFEGVSNNGFLVVYSNTDIDLYKNSVWGQLFIILPYELSVDNHIYILQPNNSDYGNIAMWFGCSEDGTELIIPSTIMCGDVKFKVIYCDASKMKDRTAIRKITLPPTIYTIFNFKDFTNLEEINFPEGLMRINIDAFKNCVKLRIPTLPNSVFLYANPFPNCVATTEFVVAEGSTNLKTIDGMLYTANNQLIASPAGRTAVSVPDDITSIGPGAFVSSVVTSIKLPAELQQLYPSAFADCLQLRSVSLADTNRQFFIDDGVIYYGRKEISFAVYTVLPWIKDLILPEGTYSATMFSDVIVNPAAIESIEIPQGCSYVSLPLSLPSLTKVTCRNTAAPIWYTSDPSEYDFFDSATLYIPEGTKDNYMLDYYMWKNFTHIEEIDMSSVENISADEIVAAEYYNLQGIRVENPSNGIYIKRQGSVTSKVAIP